VLYQLTDGPSNDIPYKEVIASVEPKTRELLRDTLCPICPGAFCPLPHPVLSVYSDFVYFILFDKLTHLGNPFHVACLRNVESVSDPQCA